MADNDPSKLALGGVFVFGGSELFVGMYTTSDFWMELVPTTIDISDEHEPDVSRSAPHEIDMAQPSSDRSARRDR